MIIRNFLLSGFFITGLFASGQPGMMLKAPKDFTFIPAGTAVVRGQEKAYQAFYMYKQEITNGQYKLFLNDLKKNNDTVSLKIARIQQEKWADLGISNTGAYFEMDDMPVVCVSKEAANLFCKWMQKKIQDETKDNTAIEIRLPMRDEWEYAAQSGAKFTDYPWKGNDVKNDQGQYLAHFKVLGQPVGPMKVRSFPPSEFKLYDMSGNVSEMVSDMNIAMGGNWNSPAAEIKISWEDPLSVSSTIGFRPVFTYIRK